MTDKASAIRPDMVRELRSAFDLAATIAEEDRTPGYGPHKDAMEHLAETQRNSIARRIREAGERFASRITSALSPVFIERMAALEAENARLRAALQTADDAIAYYIRYLDGGEMRGSYDGKPERDALRRAGYATRSALSCTILQEHAESGERQGDEG